MDTVGATAAGGAGFDDATLDAVCAAGWLGATSGGGVGNDSSADLCCDGSNAGPDEAGGGSGTGTGAVSASITGAGASCFLRNTP